MNFSLEQTDIDRIAEAVACRLAEPVRKTQWLTRQEAADHLRCGVKHLDRLVRLGEIPVYRPAGEKGRPLFKAEDLDSFVHQTRREW